MSVNNYENFNSNLLASCFDYDNLVLNKNWLYCYSYFHSRIVNFFRMYMNLTEFYKEDNFVGFDKVFFDTFNNLLVKVELKQNL